MSYVRIEKPQPHTSVIVLDRPERMNSMSFDLVVPLHDALDEIANDNDTWTVILTGTGRGFCSGADTGDMEPPPNIDGLTLTRIATRAMRILADLVPKMRRMPQPVICAINGAAIGGGMCLSLGADVRIVGDYREVLELLIDCNPSIALRTIRATRPKNVKSDAEETDRARKKALQLCHRALGRDRVASG